MGLLRAALRRPPRALKPMKKFFVTAILLSLACVSFAEAIKLKTGLIINGTITGQSEYVLNVKTTYGTITLNQREVEAIMPDLYRVLLKGGGEFVGTITDLDEFNLTLKTDSGAVNIDVNNIASMEVYDYDEAEKQQKYITNKVEKEAQAAAALAEAGDGADQSSLTAAAAQAGSSLSESGGLAFDEDLEKIFPSKPAIVEPNEVIRYHANTAPNLEEQAQAAQEESEDEKRFIDLLAEEKPIEQALRINDKNYFAVHAGALTSGVKINMEDAEHDLSGTNIGIGVAYLRRLTNRLWLGGSVAFGMLPRADIEQQRASGQLYQFDLLSHFYFNPKSLMRVYALGGVGFSSVSINLNAKDSSGKRSTSFSSGGFAGIFGLGLERSIADLNLGLEARGIYATYDDELKESRSLNLLTTLKISWFF